MAMEKLLGSGHREEGELRAARAQRAEAEEDEARERALRAEQAARARRSIRIVSNSLSKAPESPKWAAA